MTTPFADLPNDASRDAEGGDLDWLAFRYLAGESDDAEVAAFEQRLADDQHARERLAAAVALLEGIAACEIEPVAPSLTVPASAAHRTARPETGRGSLLRPIAWWSMVAALLIAAIWLGYRPGDNDPTASTPNSESADVQLAATWASLLQDGDEGGSGESPAALGAASGDESTAAPPAIDEPLDTPLDAPDWMLAALGGEGIANEPGAVDSQGEYDDIDMDMEIDGDVSPDNGTHDG